METTVAAQLPGTGPAPVLDTPYATMLDGLHRYADNLTAHLAAVRRLDWEQRLQPADAGGGMAARRQRLREIIGAADPRCTPLLSVVADAAAGDLVARAGGVTIRAVRWSVLAGLEAEGRCCSSRSARRGPGWCCCPIATSSPRSSAACARIPLPYPWPWLWRAPVVASSCRRCWGGRTRIRGWPACA